MLVYMSDELIDQADELVASLLVSSQNIFFTIDITSLID
jgi:hypothetical protein